MSQEMPQISLHAMNRVQNYRTLRVKGIVGKHTIHILVDCGSTHNFLDAAVAKKLGCPIKSICPLSVTVGDGYNVATTSECRKFKWQLQGVNFCSDVMCLPLVGCEIILGIQWLSTLGDIKCNFKELRMEFMYKSKKMVLRGTPKSNSEWMSGNKQNKMERQGKQPEFSSMQLCVFPSAEVSLMRLEGISKELDPELQHVVDEFADVFVVPKELPPRRPCDHRIPLLEGTNPINIRPYRHPPTKKEAIGSMVQELLDTGVIRQSHSPFASPIVMVKKKDNTWRMCVDYKQLNNNTIKDKFPIPIIEELIDELHGLQIFSKLDMRSGQVEYLGHVISDMGVATDPSKIQAMENRPVPTNVKQ
ncbi:reverse transcriptase [Tanacetum coccineum]